VVRDDKVVAAQMALENFVSRQLSQYVINLSFPNTDVALRMDVPQMSHVIYPLTSCIGEYTLGAKAFCGVLKMSRRCCENILGVLGSKL
jgi:hypothetical protein